MFKVVWDFEQSALEIKRVNDYNTPSPRNSVAMTNDTVDKLYLFGGANHHGLLNDLYQFNTNNNTWTHLANLEIPAREMHSIHYYSGQITIKSKDQAKVIGIDWADVAKENQQLNSAT